MPGLVDERLRYVTALYVLVPAGVFCPSV